MPTVLNRNASIVPRYCTFQFVTAKCALRYGIVRRNTAARSMQRFCAKIVMQWRNSYVTSQTTCNDIKCQDNVDVADDVTSFDGIALFVAILQISFLLAVALITFVNSVSLDEMVILALAHWIDTR